MYSPFLASKPNINAVKLNPGYTYDKRHTVAGFLNELIKMVLAIYYLLISGLSDILIIIKTHNENRTSRTTLYKPFVFVVCIGYIISNVNIIILNKRYNVSVANPTLKYSMST